MAGVVPADDFDEDIGTFGDGLCGGIGPDAGADAALHEGVR